MKINDIIEVILKQFELGEIHAYLYVNGLITNTKIEYGKNVMTINNIPEYPPLIFRFTDPTSRGELLTIETKKNNEVSSLNLEDVNYQQLQIYQLLYAPLLLNIVRFEHAEIQSIPISIAGLGEITLENSVITINGKYPLGYKFFQNLIQFIAGGKNYEQSTTEREITIKIDLGNYLQLTSNLYRTNFMPRLLEIEQEEILSRDIISIRFDPPTFFKDLKLY